MSTQAQGGEGPGAQQKSQAPLNDKLQQRQQAMLNQRSTASQQQQAAAVANESGVLAKRKIKEIVEQVSPGERIDPEVEEVLLEIAEDFVSNVTNWACQLAKHRRSQTLEVQDLRLHLEKHWQIKVPGFSEAEERARKKANAGADGQPKKPSAGGGSRGAAGGAS